MPKNQLNWIEKFIWGIADDVLRDVYVRGKYRDFILPVVVLRRLDTAHIKPFSKSGPNYTRNGLLIRSDIHKLFDKGYVTITPDYTIEVSKRIKEEYENGREY